MPEGKSLFEKKLINKSKSQIKVVITFNWNYSRREVPSPRQVFMRNLI